jgi:nicotinate-nucleotide adenylyltransferase
MVKVGFYGGSFDPVHFGHVSLAIDMMEAHHLDEIWFCPAQVNPHKQEDQPLASHHRLAMLEIALREIPHFKILEMEIKRKGPSYTLDTLRELIEQEKKNQIPKEFSLILGDDSIPHFFQWHQPKEIVRLVPLLIGRRNFQDITPLLKGDPEICAAIRKGFTRTRIMEISATDIRQRIYNGLYVGHLLPAKVIDYIYEHHLYF